MIKVQPNEIRKENFDNFHLEVENNLADKLSADNSRTKREWKVKSSEFAINTTNPIRAIVEHLNVQPNPNKAFIPLSVGEYCLFYEFVSS